MAEPAYQRFLLPDAPVDSVAQWVAIGGGQGLDRARRLGPDQTIKELALARVRGRGGAGFPVARKWAGVRDQPGTRRYVVANAAEGEPATFKDRAIIRANPYQVIEGLAIASVTMEAHEVFIGVKGSFHIEIERLTRAVAEMQEAGLAGDAPFTIVAGPDEYLFGEEKALLEVIEGKPPLPRLLAPFEHGLFATGPQVGWESTPAMVGSRERDLSNPTLVNNVETLATVTHVLAKGSEWHRSMGTEGSPGHLVVTVVGDVIAPGVAEVPMGTALGDAITTIGGGVGAGRTIKAVFSGVANPVITASQLDTALSYEAMTSIGSGLGAAGFAVYDDTACMVRLAAQLSRFLSVESCGQCPACKLGTGEITARLSEIDDCHGDENDIAVIGARLKNVTDGARCYLPIQEQRVIGSILRAFPEEFADRLGGVCPRPRPDLIVPIIVDLVDGKVRYDRKRRRKLPDWTYEPKATRITVP